MKDTVIQLKTGVNYYILEELTYNQKKYIMAAQCDLEKDYIDQENLVIMEVKQNENEVIVDEIHDDNIATNVVELFQEKYQSKED